MIIPPHYGIKEKSKKITALTSKSVHNWKFSFILELIEKLKSELNIESDRQIYIKKDLLKRFYSQFLHYA